MPLDIKKIESLRQARGWLRPQLAEEAKMQRTHLYAVLDGRKPRVSLDVAQRLAKALGVGIDAIVR